MRSATAFITVECDECGASENVELTTTTRGYDERDVDGTLEGWGWLLADGRDLCNDCANKLEDDAAPAAEAKRGEG